MLPFAVFFADEAAVRVSSEWVAAAAVVLD
jgi:hypothetical protein